ncbi:MAG: isoprenylcysteine carboxylmethyltransferase family protein [Candidatus Lokiarchaeia archaeon]
MTKNKERSEHPVWLYLIVVFTLFFSVSIGITLLFKLPWYFHFDTIWGWYPPIPPLWGMPYYTPLITPGSLGVGIILLAVGFFVLVSALRVLRISRAFGEEIHKPKKESKLITTGIYAYSRNPVYLGSTIMLFGWFLVTLFTFLLIVTLLFMILFYLVARWEEKELSERFGEEYRQYKENVPLFIPYPKKLLRRKRQ